jgi:hypothetical protein
LGVGG